MASRLPSENAPIVGAMRVHELLARVCLRAWAVRLQALVGIRKKPAPACVRATGFRASGETCTRSGKNSESPPSPSPTPANSGNDCASRTSRMFDRDHCTSSSRAIRPRCSGEGARGLARAAGLPPEMPQPTPRLDISSGRGWPTPDRRGSRALLRFCGASAKWRSRTVLAAHSWRRACGAFPEGRGLSHFLGPAFSTGAQPTSGPLLFER